MWHHGLESKCSTERSRIKVIFSDCCAYRTGGMLEKGKCWFREELKNDLQTRSTIEDRRNPTPFPVAGQNKNKTRSHSANTWWAPCQSKPK